MTMMLLTVGYALYAIAATFYFCINNKWTALRYLLGMCSIFYWGSPDMLSGFNPGSTIEEKIVTVIWLHLSGSVFSPYIFFFTVLPVLIFLGVFGSKKA